MTEAIDGLDEGTEELTQEGMVEFANVIEDLEEKKAALGAEINELIKDCAERFALKKKELKTALKNYKQWKADRAKFNTEVTVIDRLTDILTGEKCVTFVAEKDLND